jgi:phosphoglycolate phosphatase
MMIFFDLDGTLIDVSQKYYAVYVAFVRNSNGVPLPLDAYWEIKRGNASPEDILAASRINDQAPRALDEFVKANIEREEYLRLDRLFSFTDFVLHKLSFEHICILISKRRNKILFEKQTEWLNIKKYFKSVIAAGNMSENGAVTSGTEKSDAMKALEITLPACIIGDSGMDILTGKSLGITTCAVTTGIRNREILQSCDPDFIIDKLADILDVVEKLRR